MDPKHVGSAYGGERPPPRKLKRWLRKTVSALDLGKYIRGDQRPSTWKQSLKRSLGGIGSFLDVGEWVLRFNIWRRTRGLSKEGKAARAAQKKAVRAAKSKALGTPGFFRRNWMLLTLLAVMAVMAASFPYAYARFRQWRTDNLLKRGKEQLASKEWSAAETSAKNVLILRKTDQEAGWLMFRALRGMESPNAVDVAFQLGSQPGLTGEQKYEILSFLIESQPQGAFLSTFGRLPLAEQENPRMRAIYARFLTNRREFRTAGALLAAARERDSDTGLLRERARLACRMGSPTGLLEAAGWFQKLDAIDKVEALTVLRLIAKSPLGILPNGLEDIDRLEAWLKDIPGATTQDRFLAFDGRLALGEPEGGVAAAVIKKFGDSNPVGTVRWLSARGRHEDVMDIASRPGVDRVPMFAELVQAQIALNHFPEARLTVSSPPTKFDPTELSLLRFRLARSSNDPNRKFWEDALLAVSKLGNCTGCLKLADLVAHGNSDADPGMVAAFLKSGGPPPRVNLFGMGDLAAAVASASDRESAIAAAYQQRGGPLPLFRDIGPLATSLAKQDRIPELTRILANLLRFEDGNAPLVKSYMYLQCLDGKIKPQEALPVLREICRREVGDDYTQALSFILLLSGEAREAVKLLSPIERSTGNDKLLNALLGAALKHCNNNLEAEPLLSTVQWGSGQLLPIEERGLQRLIGVNDVGPIRRDASPPPAPVEP